MRGFHMRIFQFHLKRPNSPCTYPSLSLTKGGHIRHSFPTQTIKQPLPSQTNLHALALSLSLSLISLYFLYSPSFSFKLLHFPPCISFLSLSRNPRSKNIAKRRGYLQATNIAFSNYRSLTSL